MAIENFFSAISIRIDAINSAKIKRPERRAVPGESIVGRASPYLMRLHQLRIDLNHETSEIEQRLRAAAEAYNKLVPDDLNENIVALRSLANSKEFETVLGEVMALKTKLEPAVRLTKLVDQIFWHEIRQNFPVAEKKPLLYLNSNWDVCWAEDRQDGGLSEMLAKLSGHSAR